jgi:hypothetical protein
MPEAGQIMNDLIPISRLEGDVADRGYWMLYAGWAWHAVPLQNNIL